MAQQKKAFVMYQDFWSSVEMLSMIDRGRLLTAAYEFHGTGQTSLEMRNKGLQVAWNALRATLERDAVRYEESCERNAKNGKKGGRPRKSQTLEETSNIEDPKPLEMIEVLEGEKNPQKPKQADIEKERDRDRERKINIGMDIERGGGIKTGCCEAPSPKETSRAAPPPSSSSPTAAEREELYRLGVPQSFYLKHWELACEYCKEHSYTKRTDALYLWWKEERKARTGV